MMKLLLITLLLSVACFGELPDAPTPKAPGDHVKAKIIANVTLAGAVYVSAWGRASGARACRGEANRDGFPPNAGYRPSSDQRKYYEVAIPLAAAGIAYSFLANHFHWHGAITVPVAGATALATSGLVLQAQGCT